MNTKLFKDQKDYIRSTLNQIKTKTITNIPVILINASKSKNIKITSNIF